MDDNKESNDETVPTAKSIWSQGIQNSGYHETKSFYSTTSVAQGEEETPKQESGCANCQCLVFPRDHPVAIAWSCILFVLLTYVATIFLYRFSFLAFHVDDTGINPIGEGEAWNVWDAVVDILFWFDLVFTFFLSYDNHKGAEIVDFWLGAKRYLKFMFWLNLFACLPEEVFRALLKAAMDKGNDQRRPDASVTRVVRLQRISRLARLARLTRLAKLVQFQGSMPGMDWFSSLRGVRVSTFLIRLVWISHLLACGWYLIAALHDDVTVTWLGSRTVVVQGEERSLLQQGPFEQWLVAMYFVLTVFTTVGFGDISAGTEAEIMYVVLTMLVGAVVHSIIISEVIQVVTSTDKAADFIKDKMNLLEAFSLHADLDPESRMSIRAELAEASKNWAEKLSFDRDEMKTLLLSKLFPRSIIGKLPDVLYRGKLCENQFLRCCSDVAVIPPRLPCLLAINLMPAEFMSGEVVFQLHDFAFNLGLVLSGTFAFVGQAHPEGGHDSMLAANTSEEDSAPQRVTSYSPASVRRWTSPMPLRAQWSRPPSSPEVVRDRMSTRHGITEVNVQGLAPYKLLGAKTYFGDIECITGSMRLATLRCERSGMTLLLRKVDFFELVDEFPHVGQVWASSAWKNESHRCSAVKRLTVPRSCKHFAAFAIQTAYRQRKWSPSPLNGRSGSMMHKHARGIRGVAHYKAKQYNHRDLKEMTAPAPSNSFVLREVEKVQHVVSGMQSDMKYVKEMLQVLCPGKPEQRV